MQGNLNFFGKKNPSLEIELDNFDDKNVIVIEKSPSHPDLGNFEFRAKPHSSICSYLVMLTVLVQTCVNKRPRH